MFLCQDKSKKKRLQKPNILRRNPKTFKSINKDLDLIREKPIDASLLVETVPKNGSKKDHKMKTLSEVNESLDLSEVEPKQTCLIPIHSDITDVQPSLNVDSFLIRHSEEQNKPFKKNKQNAVGSHDKVCFAFIDDSNPFISGNCRHLKELCSSEKINFNSFIPHTFNERTETVHSDNELVRFSIDGISQSRTKYKCDVGDCGKVFLSEEKLLKHKNTHNKVCRIARPSVFECPVKNSSKLEVTCHKVFLVKEELIKHINEDHSVDDAAFKCDVCERRFFWASGLRAHKRSHVERASFACPWPECGRVFRHACRLREHSRAHTGAKPYHCTYPNCDWSFRTASKLLRHSRRHTGDRRHTCVQCGRAFLRREHLRDHEARHHTLEDSSNAVQDNNTCDINAKQQKPIKKSDKSTTKVKRKQNTCNVESDPERLKKTGQKFMVELWEGNQKLLDQQSVAVPDMNDDDLPKSGDVKDSLLGPGSCEDFVAFPEEGKDLVISHGDKEFVITTEDLVIQTREEGDLVITSHFEGERDFVLTTGPDDLVITGEEARDDHAARTHCTWPLQKADYNSDDYVLEDDVQVEQLEGSESNVFTVRSDLFLHGSVFHNDDSEQMCSAVRASVSERVLDSELMLDAPSVHLAQEELYTDAVDESSFRVFLLSGEDLT
ncbi:zinc finger protein 479 [Pieris rapae]|uniref:zinc finger protein 479 n=1 Tax=Pieris rapae TaxID=64459 RepID=UPI001E27E61D|nr:zinc finger protein 479 [Pieris rapae]